MKRILYYILLATIVLMQSCLKEEENIFEASSADRMTTALKEYQDILESAPNGWHMSYFSGTAARPLGGYNYIVSFKDGEVTASTEFAIKSHAIGDKVKSLYKMISDRGPVLSFDTYNDLLHYFSTPSSLEPQAKYGDYEFVVESATKDMVVLKGKKYKNPIMLTPLPAGKDWKEYLDQTNTILSKVLKAPSYFLKAGDKTMRLYRTAKYFTGSYIENGKTISFTIPFISTLDGISFMVPVAFEGKELQNFKYEVAGEDGFGKFVSKDTNATDVSIIIKKLPLNESFEQSLWVFDKTKISSELQESWTKAAENLVTDKEGVLTKGIIGTSIFSSYPGTTLAFFVNPWWASYMINVVPVEGSTDRLSFKLKGEGLNGAYFNPYFKDYLKLIFDSSPYKMLPDDLENPTVITLTSETNPLIYFTVELDQ